MAVGDGPHPAAERLAEYADGVLAAEVRAEVERHLADCAACRAVVMETMAFLEHSPAVSVGAAAPRVRPFRSRTRLISVAAGLAAAAAIVLAVRVVRPEWPFGQRSDRPELQELIAAVANEPTRPVEGRLSGGFRYAPPPPTTRGGADGSVSPDVTIAVAKIQKQVQGSVSSSSRAALGAALLLSGQCAKAISILESGSDRGLDASTLNNLSVARMRCAREGREDLDLLARAVDAAEKAIASAPEAPEAYFNRALALGLAGRNDESLAAWRRYLERDATSNWAAEARARIDQQGR